MNKSSKTNWERIDALTDETVDTTDIPALQESFFQRAIPRMPPELVSMNVRLDPQVIDWFKAQGGNWEERLNAALRIYASSHRMYGGGAGH